MEDRHFESLFPDTARSEEIKKLLKFVSAGKSCQLLGLPGAGRANLLSLLAYNKSIREKHLGEKSKFVHFILLDFSEMRSRPLYDAMKFLFLGLTESLKERGMTEEYERVNTAFREALSFNDELVLFQELKQAVDFLALEKKLTLIFLFNRFEDYIPSVTSEFFRNLRILRNRAKYRFSVVFSVDRPLESLVDPAALSDFYEYIAGYHLYIRIYDEPSVNFLLSYLEKLTGKKLDKTVVSEILKLTGGFAKITRLVFESCLARPHPDPLLKGEGVIKLVDFLLSQSSIRSSLSDIWLELTPAEQSDIQQATFEDIEVLKYLEDSGLISGKKIQIPLFAQYLRVSKTVLKTAEEKIVFDENTNSIRKGKIMLSDNLTSSEFKLLRHLLLNQDKVVERDEIISVVWQSVKSTAGITDQAVDQLIFRLRRKIEEDPNTPQHLQTVKGRGFRFLP